MGFQRWKRDLRRTGERTEEDVIGPRPSIVTPLLPITTNTSGRAILNNKGARTRVVSSEKLSVSPVGDHTGQTFLGMFYRSPFWVFMRHTKFT